MRQIIKAVADDVDQTEGFWAGMFQEHTPAYLIVVYFSGCVGVHAFGAMWGLIAVGLFARKDHLRYALDINHQHYGLFYVSLIEHQASDSFH